MTTLPDHEGYAGHQWDLPVPPGARQIRGGNSYELFQPMHPDDIVTATWQITDITEKPSRTGGTMVFIISEIAYTNQRGEALATNTDTMIWQVPS
jgi:N-terminal half of MaoC dehydratase